MEITYFPMKKGFMYLSAVIDLYNRYVVGWQVSNRPEKETRTELLASAIKRYSMLNIISANRDGNRYLR